MKNSFNSSHSVQVPCRVGAILVIFEWESKSLLSLLSILLKQVEAVCIMDNGSPKGQSSIVWPERVVYLLMGENRGIAHAQNVGFDYFQQRGFDAVLLVDQDTIFPEGYVLDAIKQWQTLSNQGIRLAAFGPSYIDRKSGRQSKGIRYSCLGGVRRIDTRSVASPFPVDYVIASGSFIPVQTWFEVGGMNEALFIYWVDIEWGLRAKSLGFKSYLLPEWIIDHSIGQSIFNFFGRKIPIHDGFRQYFIIRNPFLMLRYRTIPVLVRFRTILDVLLKYVPIYILVSKHKMRTIKILLRAIKDGLLNRGGHPNANR